MDFNDSIIYGKNAEPRIVSIEPDGSICKLFIQEPDGSITIKPAENFYWVLSDTKLNGKYVKLRGHLPLQYGCLFQDKEAWQKHYYMNSRKCRMYRVSDVKENFLTKSGMSYFKGLQFRDVSILGFDLETTGLDGTALDAKVLLIANTFRAHDGQITRKLFAYDDYTDEGALLKAWADWVFLKDPSIMAAHNGFGFDLPYLLARAKANGVTLDIGRDGSAAYAEKYESQFRKDQTQKLAYHRVRVYGREMVDTMFLAIRYDAATHKYESYALKSIIATEGMEKKDRVFYDASQIRNNYTDPVEWAKIKAYCEFDADDVLSLWDLMAPPYFYLTQSVPKSFQNLLETATGAQINAVMVRSYLQDAHSIPVATPTADYTGAISFGNPGIYKNVLKLDLNALYPSIMRQYKIHDPEKDPKGHFLHLVDIFTLDRLKNKKLAKETGNKYYADLEQSQKIFINSCYGMLGTLVSFNSPKLAAQITEYGREILKFTYYWATGAHYVPEPTDKTA